MVEGLNTLIVGDSIALTAVVRANGVAIYRPVIWTTTDRSVAEVSSAGIVRGRSRGIATVTASLGSVTGARTVKVVGVRAITLTPDTAIIPEGGSARLTTNIVADSGVAAPLLWASSAPAIATVSTDGVIAGVSAGTALISVESRGTQAQARINVRRTNEGIGVGFGEDQFTRIEAGTFLMGSNTGTGNERPIRRITLTQAFQLQRTEVTQAQWRTIMGTNPSANAACGLTCPVEQVSWTDVLDFIDRLNARDPGKGYRLPTEAEWEYAARAGTTGDYGGSGNLSEMGWWTGNSGGSTWSVGQKRPNAWGLHDMHGNVWELVSDWYGTYAAADSVNPRGPTTGVFRIWRGGSRTSPSQDARSATRVETSNLAGFRGTGFRLVRNP